MMRLFAKVLMLVGSLTISTQLLALGLGELTLNSALNQPLDAEIELVDAEGLSQWEIKPFLASNVAFEQAGVDRPYFLTKIRFKVEGDKIRLTTKDPVTEPFLNFLLELNWPSGRVLREYTVLLDPPTFDDDNYQPLASAPSSTGMETTQFSGGSNKVSSPRSGQNQTGYVPASNRKDTSSDRGQVEQAGTYRVQPNDTLWSIALQTRPSRDVTPQQMMVAIQNENPEAFIGGNINRLKTHHVLRIPDQDKVNGITFNAAVSEVARQNREVNTGPAQLDATGRDFSTGNQQRNTSGGEVKLVSAQSSQARSAGAGGDVTRGSGGRQEALENELSITLENLDKAQRENKDLRERLDDLNEQIESMQRLLTMKNSQLAHMQATAGQKGDAPVDGKVADANSTGSDGQAGNNNGNATDSTLAGTGQVGADSQIANNNQFDANNQAAGKDAQKPAVNKVEPVTQPFLLDPTPPKPKSFIDTLLKDWVTLLGGLAALLLLAAAAVLYLRKRKEAQDDDIADAEDTAIAEPISLETEDDEPVAAAIDDAPKDDFDELNNFNFDTVSEDGNNDLMGGLDLGDDFSSTSSESDINSEGAGEEVASTADDDSVDVSGLDFGDEDDDLFELVDLDVAYGRFDDAVGRLQGAIDAQPGRTDVRLRLLELLVEMGDPARYVEQENAAIEMGDAELIQQASDLRQLLSDPIEPTAVPAAGIGDVAADVDASIDQIDAELNDSLDEGIAFGDALDISDDDQGMEEFSFDEEANDLEGQESDDDLLDLATLEAELGDDATHLDDAEDQAEGDDNSMEFDLSSLAEQHDEEEAAETELDDSNLMEFDTAELVLDEADETESDLTEVDDENAMEFDLDSLGALVEEETSEEAQEEPDNLMDFEEIEVDASVDDLDEEASSEEDFAEDNQVDFDLSELETDLGDLDEEEAEPEQDDEQALDFDLSELDSDLGDLDADEETEDTDNGEDSLEALMDSELADHGDFDIAELQSEFGTEDLELSDSELSGPEDLSEMDTAEDALEELPDLESLDGLSDEPNGALSEVGEDDLASLDAELGDMSDAGSDELPELESLDDLPELETLDDLGEELGTSDTLAELDDLAEDTSDELPELESLDSLTDELMESDGSELDKLPELDSLDELPELESLDDLSEKLETQESDVLVSLDAELANLTDEAAENVANVAEELPELDGLDELPELDSLDEELEGLDSEQGDALAALDAELESLDEVSEEALEELPELESLEELPELESLDDLASDLDTLPELEDEEDEDRDSLNTELTDLSDETFAEVSNELPELEAHEDVTVDGNIDQDKLPELDSLEELPELDSLDDSEGGLEALPELESLETLPELDESIDTEEQAVEVTDELPELESLDALTAELDEELPELDSLEELPELTLDEPVAEVSEELPELENLEGELEELPELDALPELELEDGSEVPVAEVVDDLPELEPLDDLAGELEELPELDALPELELEDGSDVPVAEVVDGLPELEPLDDLAGELEDLPELDALPESELEDGSEEVPVAEVVDDLPELELLDDLAGELEELPELESLDDIAEESVSDSDVAEAAIAAAAVAAAASGIKTNDIDLDALAKSDDEFDFLSGTDECDTKLELAQEYLNMGDEDGARELLGEVVAEGTDPQIQKARELLDTFA